MTIRVLLTAAAVGSVALAAQPALARRAALDAGLIAEYTASSTGVQFTVCGSTLDSGGCFGGGTMSPPFEQACAVLEGTPKTRRNVVSRDIYVLDKRTSASDPATLYVYTRADTITDSYDSVQVTLKKQIPLGVTGGSSANCFMVASDAFVYASTDASATIGVVDQKALTVSPLSGSGLVTGMTADERGYVAVNFQGEFGIADPTGRFEQSGGGHEDVVSTRNAWKP